MNAVMFAITISEYGCGVKGTVVTVATYFDLKVINLSRFKRLKFRTTTTSAKF